MYLKFKCWNTYVRISKQSMVQPSPDSFLTFSKPFSWNASEEMIDKDLICDPIKLSLSCSSLLLSVLTDRDRALLRLVINICLFWLVEANVYSDWWKLLSLLIGLASASVQFSSGARLCWLFATPWTAACQASPSITNSQSLLKLMSIESVMPSNHLIFFCPLLLLPSIFPSIRVFSNEPALCIKCPRYWSFSF